MKLLRGCVAMQARLDVRNVVCMCVHVCAQCAHTGGQTPSDVTLVSGRTMLNSELDFMEKNLGVDVVS